MVQNDFQLGTAWYQKVQDNHRDAGMNVPPQMIAKHNDTKNNVFCDSIPACTIITHVPGVIRKHVRKRHACEIIENGKNDVFCGNIPACAIIAHVPGVLGKHVRNETHR
jgi:hypothetical protein